MKTGVPSARDPYRAVLRRGVLALAACSSLCLPGIGAESPFPSADELAGARAGELVLKPGIFRGQSAAWGTLVVPENRDQPGGKLLHLPVLKIPARKNTGLPPVFYFFGGPGASNIRTSWTEGYFADHDFVQVGYRGVDGSVRLAVPELGKVLRSGSPSDPEMLRRAGQALAAGLVRLQSEGIDLNRYTMMEVIDDVEAARKALGYGKINLLSHSYGTQLAHLYGLRYPGSIGRNLMIGASAPGLAGIWEPAEVDAIIRRYAELWKQDPGRVRRAADLERTLCEVLDGLPRDRNGARVDPGKVKLATFTLLYDPATAVQVLDAFVSAQEGDWGGLALLSASWDRNPLGGLSLEDAFCKLISAGVYQRGRDYLQEMNPPGTIIGSPLTRFSMGLIQLNPGLLDLIRPIPDEYRTGRTSEVETLVVNGALDLSSPVSLVERELMPRLKHGKRVVLPNLGHNGPFTQPKGFFQLMSAFFRTGEVDASAYTDTPVNFTPVPRLTEVAKGTAGVK